MRRLAAAILIAAVPAMAAAGVTFFGNQSDFDDFNTSQGYVLGVGGETFEENTMGTGAIIGINDPLTQGTLNGPFPTGLDHNVTVQANTLGGAASQVSPRGVNGLVGIALGAGFGESSDIVLSNFTADSFDLIFPGTGNYRSVGFDAITLQGSSQVQVQVYDRNNVLLGQGNVGASTAGTFGGLAADAVIGRINIWDAAGSKSEGVDNISVYVPEPASLCLLAVAGLLLGRRR